MRPASTQHSPNLALPSSRRLRLAPFNSDLVSASQFVDERQLRAAVAYGGRSSRAGSRAASRAHSHADLAAMAAAEEDAGEDQEAEEEGGMEWDAADGAQLQLQLQLLRPAAAAAAAAAPQESLGVLLLNGGGLLGQPGGGGPAAQPAKRGGGGRKKKAAADIEYDEASREEVFSISGRCQGLRVTLECARPPGPVRMPAAGAPAAARRFRRLVAHLSPPCPARRNYLPIDRSPPRPHPLSAAVSVNRGGERGGRRRRRGVGR